MAAYDAALRAGPVPYETRMVETRFGQTHVVIGGQEDAPPMVLFHGWNGNASNTGAEFSFVFPHYRAYIPDIIGHPGKSAPSRPPTAGSAYVDWACDVLDGLALDRPVAMGISGGGWMVLKIASYAPHRISRGVALATDGLTGLTLWKALGLAPAGLWPNPTTIRWFMRTISPQVELGSRQMEVFGRQLELTLRHFRTQRNPGRLTDDELRRIGVPILVLMGDQECFFDARRAVARAKALIPDVVAEVVPNAGHAMTMDQPEYLAHRVMEFLGDPRQNTEGADLTHRGPPN